MKAKRIIAFILTFLFIMNCTPVTFAEDAGPAKFDISGSKTADKELLTDKDRDVTITLSLPSAEYKNEYDIVFVMDSSTSTTNSDINFAKYADEMFQELIKHDAKINVGIVKFRGIAIDPYYELNATDEKFTFFEYNDENAKLIADGINYVLEYKDSSGNKVKTELRDGFVSSGTNDHAGLEAVSKMLSASDTPRENKFVIFLTDGKTYIWNDENGVATSYYAQYYKDGKGPGDYGSNGKLGINQTYNTDIAPYHAVCDQDLLVRFAENVSGKIVGDEYANLCYKFFMNLYESDNEELVNKTKYDTKCEYAYGNGSSIKGTYNEYTTTNGAIVVAKGSDSNRYSGYKDYHQFVPEDENIHILEANPYNAVFDEEGNCGFDLNSPNENFYMYHPTNMDKALYKSAHLWSDIVEDYNAAAIYCGSSKAGCEGGWGSGGGLSLADGFDVWLGKVSDFAARIDNTQAVVDIFTTIRDDILYMVASGTVTDIIPEEFDIDVDSFKMTYDGASVVRTDGTGDATYFFGEANNEGYPYELAYRTADMLGEEFEGVTGVISWSINVPVENIHPITLSYTLTLKDKLEDGTEVAPGEYDTNVAFTYSLKTGPVIDENGFGAVLGYTTSDKEPGVYGFEVPSVTYKKHYTVSYEYTGTVPEGAPALPEATSYLNGESVTVAPAPEMDYYTFSGWDTDNFIMPAEDVVIKGSWEPIFYNITVNYVDVDGNILANSVTTDPIQAGTAYDVSKLDQIAIDGYKWVSTSLDTKGDKLEKALAINVVYAKLGEYAVTVNYVDEAGNKIAESVVTTVQEGEKYDVTALDQAAIAGYTYKETSGELTGTIGTEDITIDVIYTKNRPHKPSKDPEEPTVPEVPEEPAEPEVPAEPVVTVPEVPEEPAVIEEPEVPLAEPEEPLDIFEEEVPLADVPTTGDTTRIWLASFIFSALALGVLNLLGRREEEGSL